MKLAFGYVLLVLICAASTTSFASVVQPDDGPYYRLRRGRILYVYDGVAKENVPQIAGYMEAVRGLYDKSFNWTLSEEQDLVLTSPNQQIANAYATVSPNIASVWFPAGGGFLEDSAESSWFLTLATHETAHLYQLDAKGPVNQFLWHIFGNGSLFTLPIPIPIISPNQLTPTFLVEGNAVMNESRANMGGRLHSGEYRALVLSQIKAGEITPTRLINNEFRFPFGQNPYAQGAYFQAHLAAKYGVDKTNQFFLAQGDHWLWPFILNPTFRDHFGASYPQEIHEYVREMQGLADKQNVSNGKTIVDTIFISPLNHDDSRIFFQEAGGIYPNRLHIISKKGERAREDVVDLPNGKVFFDGATPLAASSEQNDLHHITYSLYGEGLSFDPRYAGQIVSDQRGGKTASLDVANSWLENHVLVNGEAYDVAHSQPILDDAGNVYYFRQNGAERILYKNRQSLFKYDGFYGKLMEVGPDGGIYFIANTDSGSTLYEFKDREIFRVLPSDVVVDARLLDDKRVLAVEVHPGGHRAVITTAERKPAQPATYSYGFPSYNLKPEKIADSEEVKSEERSYNSLGQQRYSGLDFNMGWDPSNRVYGLAIAHFVDPLQYQAFDLGFAGAENASQSFLGQYRFTKYLLQPYARYVYERQRWQQHNDAARISYDQQVLAGWELPLLHWRHWDASWNFAAEFHHDGDYIDRTASPSTLQIRNQDTYGAFNNLTLQYMRTPDPNLGLNPRESFAINYVNKLESTPGAWRKKYNTSLAQVEYSHGFPLQFYGMITGTQAWAENHDINVVNDYTALVQDVHIARLWGYTSYTVKTASALRLELTKVFDVPAYSPRIPLSIERIAPVLVAQGMAFDSDGRNYGGYPGSVAEFGAGADVQVLLAHLVPAKLRLLLLGGATDMMYAPKNHISASFNTKFTF